MKTRYAVAGSLYLDLADDDETDDGGVVIATHSTQVIRMRQTYPTWLKVLGVLTVVILLAGFVAGSVWPGPITGLGVPVGFTLWFIVAKLAERYGRSVVR